MLFGKISSFQQDGANNKLGQIQNSCWKNHNFVENGDRYKDPP